MATKKTTTKTTPVDRLIGDVEAARARIMEFEAENSAFVEEYLAILADYQAACEILKTFCVDNFEDLAGTTVGPLQVVKTSSPDPEALKALIGEEKADKYITYKPQLTMKALEVGISRGELPESILDDVVVYRPQVRGMPSVTIKKGFQ